MKLYSINTGYFKLDGGAMFGVVPKSIWNKINPSDDNNMCPWALRSLLIQDDNRLILVDNGMGDKQDPKFFGHYYLHGDDSLDKSLKKYGFSREDITDVFLTHLHFDHCGASVSRKDGKLIPGFPNADFWSNASHWEWASNPNEREKASFLKENFIPLEESGRLKFIDQPTKNEGDFTLPSSPFLEKISVRFVEGHTRSMMLPQIKMGNKTIVYMADLLPSAGHIPLPYIMAYDMFPLITLEEKTAFLNEVVDNNYVLFFEHDPQHECCNLQRTERGIRPKDFFRLEEV